jgi:ketopantoate reductase
LPRDSSNCWNLSGPSIFPKRRAHRPPTTIAITPRLLVTGEVGTPFDLVVLAVKMYALDQALVDVARARGSDTIIVRLLNGMRHIDLLITRFGEEPVLRGVSTTPSLPPVLRVHQGLRRLIGSLRDRGGSTAG